MNPNAVAFALEALRLIPALVQAGIEVKGFIDQTTAALEKMQTENRDPTPEEWQALNGSIAELRGQLHAPGT